ncbi:hypothetical protein [Pseudoalteromonas neustonica]|uniref:hypothetical protein n=1 Tax=Pseudoalteromonas neustonica TaxID=1840331 RepID=UPI0007DB1DDA|nr:hypothetical protein [Pseudoalteromonas neustonica]
MKYLFLYLTIVFAGLTLLLTYKFIIVNEPSYYTKKYDIEISRHKHINMARKAISSQIEILNDNRKFLELCEFWSAEFFKDQNRLTKEIMDKHCD